MIQWLKCWFKGHKYRIPEIDRDCNVKCIDCGGTISAVIIEKDNK